MKKGKNSNHDHIPSKNDLTISKKLSSKQKSAKPMQSFTKCQKIKTKQKLRKERMIYSIF